MRVYISGKISGLPYEAVRTKFHSAEQRIKDCGFTPINPLRNGLPVDATWEEHMSADLIALLSCDAIFLLPDWLESQGATLELRIAERVGMLICNEESLPTGQGVEAITLRIGAVVAQVTGIPFEVFTADDDGREQDKVFARMLYAASCARILKLKPREIANYLPRKRCMVSTYLKRFPEEVQYNPAFSHMATAVERALAES